MNQRTHELELPHETRQTLQEIVRQYGTPTYAFDVQRLRAQVEKLHTYLPADVDVIYSLKANASLGICDVFQQCGIGADVASAGELATAIAAGFPPGRIFVAGPCKSAETIALLEGLPEAELSVDSPSELRMLAQAGLPNPLVLRLRPDFCSCAVVQAGHESRFGFTAEDLESCRDYLPESGVNCVGFHVFMGSQVLNADDLNGHLRSALDLSLRAADVLRIEPSLLNLGGGFGIPYGAADEELDLAAVGEELGRLAARAAPARIVLELGRYLVAEAGWYLTSVLAHQTYQGRRAVIVDGGTHQRADMCGLCLRTKARPPVVLDAHGTETAPTDVWGCLSLPADVMAEASQLPELSPGNVLAFTNAGAYGIWSSPAQFHASPLPAEVAFDGTAIQLLRERKPAASILDFQNHFVEEPAAAQV
jgi:diaminopimelate decarboxylase